MTEWWTYRPSDFLLFSPETYRRLFELHNEAWWPLGHLATLAAGILVLVCVLRGGRLPDRAAPTLLAVLWALAGWSWLAGRYAEINWAAPWLGTGFAVQAGLLLLAGTLARRMPFGALASDAGWRRLAGLALATFALLVQPFLPLLFSRPLAQVEAFGLTPDATVVFTLGVLLAARRVAPELLVLPLAWCVVSGTTLAVMEQPEAWLMPVIGVACLVAACFPAGRRRP